MTLPSLDTRVDYPAGLTRLTATVLHVEPRAEGLVTGLVAVLLDATPVHPVDAGWPDQGPDRAVLRAAAAELPVVDCVVGATDGTALYLGRDIPVQKGTAGWAFVVVHLLSGDAAPAEGQIVEVEVDADYRTRMSAGHTACHLAALGLNLALADRWKKEVRADALGNPDFDGTAIDVSLIGENQSVDTYRLGKSLRKKGFITEGLAEALPEIQGALNATLAEWVATGASVHIDADGPLLTDRRYWVCDLPGQSARIPCGGTHVSSLAELGAVRVALSTADVEGTTVLTMATFVG
ncbi:metal-dependent hydrolase [Cryobacterium sp. TMT1-21]|uniref:Metal-dependent hydrolase n=1 Tax=Cryobacterium shii TaxID=1259235 RepID=A0AAQ2C5X4_9MICO|nr:MULTISPECIES: metal-dependent hydrolase [Cryobacterium]TFC46406.1 metal-dependent hydrolase [Cryobacterium shii]TFC80745.1 metal-dependent hydrolase [Cryobacterium sp. TmT2-59]TFD17328.1 metal-dependent hydrolase [Cryobacterium sp. TMT1-21]TFD20348.1 metal-dependent hydrolase [Cryobacterium sp. TMT2-23]TFD22347.1 metal-dependent hydrolase [Cryobacterium sp. TMT4-10]